MIKHFLAIMAACCLLAGLLPGSAGAAPQDAAQESFAQGVAALNEGQASGAIEKFTAALELDPDLVEAYINRGIARIRLEHWQGAMADLERAIELAPQAYEAYYNR